MDQNDPTAWSPPAGQVERSPLRRRVEPPASYAPAVPRLRRNLPAAPADRRQRYRPDGQPWRGTLVDLER